MQRVRVGLTGLACVFLLVFLAAAFFGLARREPDAPPPAKSVVVNGVDEAVVADAPKEPLAELGVTPGNMPSGPGPAAPVPATAEPAPAPQQ
jgi:hypothetical protein